MIIFNKIILEIIIYFILKIIKMAEISFIYEGGEKILIHCNNLEEKIENIIN